jgi:hypothetical protein
MATLPVFIAASSGINLSTAGANVTINYPAGVVAGDYLVCCVQYSQFSSGSWTIGTPTGWTLLQSANDAATNGNADASFGRFAGTETSVTVSSSTGTSMSATGCIAAFKGATVNQIAPVNVSASSYILATSTAIGTPSVVTTTPGCAMALFALGYGTTASQNFTYTWTAPPVSKLAVTNISSVQGNAYFGDTIALDSAVTAGTYPASTCTASQINGGRWMVTVAIAPAPAAPTRPSYIPINRSNLF